MYRSYSTEELLRVAFTRAEQGEPLTLELAIRLEQAENRLRLMQHELLQARQQLLELAPMLDE